MYDTTVSFSQGFNLRRRMHYNNGIVLETTSMSSFNVKLSSFPAPQLPRASNASHTHEAVQTDGSRHGLEEQFPISAPPKDSTVTFYSNEFNKGRVERDRAPPAPFLGDWEQRGSSETPQSHKPGHREADIERLRERTKQHYLDNVSAARINKLRALEDLNGQPETASQSNSDGVLGAQECSNVLPPPAPPRHPSNASYETLLEEERRRVRLERKLLQERMRQHQEATAHIASVILE